MKAHCAKSVAKLVLGILCMSAAAVAAQEVESLERVLPENTLLYVSFRNPSSQQVYKESALGHILQDPEMKAFVGNVKAECLRLLEQHGGELPVDPALIEELLGNEVSVAFTGMAVSEEGMPEPGIVLSAVFERPAQEAETMLLEALERATGGVALDPALGFQHDAATVKGLMLDQMPLLYAFVGRRLLVSPSAALMRQMLDKAAGDGTALEDAEVFGKVMGHLGGSGGTLTLYADVEGLLGQFGMAIPPEAMGLVEGLGVTGMRAVGLASRFADGGMRDAFYIYAPGERTGLLQPAGNPVDLALLQNVPKDARMTSLFRLDAARTFGMVMDLIAQADPANGEEMAQGIAEAEEMLGFRIREDLLASLGTQHLFFQADHETVLMVEVRDREKFQACIDSLVELGEGNVSLDTMKHAGVTIRHLRVGGAPIPISPSYAFYGGFAVIGPYPQTLKSFIARVKGKEPSILDDEDFKRVAGKYTAGLDSISYQRIGEDLTGFYSLLTVLAPMLNGVTGASFHPELMPHPRVIQPHVFGLGSATINDADGILTESFSPFGGAGGVLALAGNLRRYGVVGPGGLPMISVMSAMLMPALASARGEARKAVCMGNLHHIGLGITLYMNDNQQFPEDLAELLPEYVADEQALLCPRDDNPVAIGGGLKSSYRYVGPLPPGTDWMVIIVYDKQGNHEDGRNALFYDTHVEFIPEHLFQARLRESLEMVKENNWENLTPQRQKEIEAFYADEAARPVPVE